MFVVSGEDCVHTVVDYWEMDLTECSLCNHQYDEKKHRARTLPCAHYYCQTCLDKVIKSATPCCPTCRKTLSTNSADSLPPNFLMDDLIRKIKTGSHSMGNEENSEDFSAGSCQKHRKCQLYFTCRTHKVKICRDCTVLDHQPSQCHIISFEDELGETKKITISNLKTQKINREKNISDLQNIIANTRTEVQKQKEEMVKLQRKINENETVIENANKGINDCLENKTKIEKIQEELISSATMNQINNSCQEAGVLIKLSNSIGTSLKNNFKLDTLQNLLDQLHMGTTVHATDTVNGEIRFSQLKVKNGDIHLPALASSNSLRGPEITFTVSSILARYPSVSSDIYIELESEGKELGIVYVKLRDNDYAKYLKRLFMGTIGPTYRGAIFRSVSASSFCTGNLNEYDKTKCLENPPEWTRTDRSTSQKGSFYIGHDTGLGFTLTGSSSQVVGDVINSMNIIKDALKYSAGKVSIKDIGIVLK